MDTREKIIKFMLGKKAKLNEVKEGLGDLYFNERDEEDIRNWCAEKAQMVWDNLTKYKDYLFGLSEEECPFCIYYISKCDFCSYNSVHGNCFDLESDFNKILNYIDSRFGTEEQHGDKFLFTNDFYVKLIESIEEEEINNVD